jgi:hypothetical protein
MSYNSTLDTFFSYWSLNAAALILFMLISFFLKSKYLEKDTGKTWFNILFAGIVIFWMLTYFLINPVFLGYGQPKGIDGVVSANGKVYVTDYLVSGGSKVSGPSKYSRIHVLDAGTGSKILRFPAGGHGTLYGVKGDELIFFHDNRIKIFSASNGKLIAKWDSKSLPEVFPELSSGIDSILLSSDSAGKMLKLTTMSGDHYNLSLQTAALRADNTDKPADKYIPTKKILLENDDRIKIDDQPGGTTLLQLQGMGANQELRYLKNSRSAVGNNNLKFLMGTFIGLSVHRNCFVVLSFESAKKTGFIISGISLDGQNKLWELKQNHLRPGDNRKQPLSTSWTVDNNSGVLFFAMKDEVIAIEILTGNILWRQTL